VSVGVAFGPPGDAHALIANGDVAMYQAKSRGRSRTVVFDGELGDADGREDLLSALGNAVGSGQLQLHHQPIVALGDSRVIAVEALLRWQHPERDLIPPAHFLRTAEDSGVIVDLDRWTLRHAVAQASQWAERGVRTPIAVNLSARSLASGDVPDEVDAALADSGLDPELLILELTERSLLPDADNHRNVLRRLHDLHVRLALDGFGTGYSSVAVLARLPIDIVKIDRSVIAQVGGPAERCVAAIVGAARGLGISVTAVGVETAAQRDLLATLRCETGQGFWWSAPVAAAGLPPLVSERDGAPAA
jgi:EAL domain-containing protein (putative c-di-GMP-specific phosphodiesterase class I)